MPLFIIIVSIYLFRLYTVITDRYVVFFIIFFINYGSALTWSLVTVRYEAAHSRLAKKRFTLREKKKGGFGDRIINIRTIYLDAYENEY